MRHDVPFECTLQARIKLMKSGREVHNENIGFSNEGRSKEQIGAHNEMLFYFETQQIQQLCFQIQCTTY